MSPRRPFPDRPPEDNEAIEPEEIFSSLDQVLETQTEQSKSLATILGQLSECRKEHQIILDKENFTHQQLAVVMDRLDGRKKPTPSPFPITTPSPTVPNVVVNTGGDQKEKTSPWGDPKFLRSLSYLVFSLCLLLFLLLMFGVKMLSFGWGDKKGYVQTETEKPAITAPR